MRELDIEEILEVGGAITWDNRTCVGTTVILGIVVGSFIGGLAGGAVGGFVGGWMGGNVCPL